MNTEALSFPKIALAGPPNCGKTSLFNALTGSRQKVANYPGVTVERKEGWTLADDGSKLCVLDLPGAYSLEARTPDEEITRDVLLGRLASETPPDTILAVADATNLERNLNLVLELKGLGRPVVLALNMMDLADSRGIRLDLDILSRELGVPVIPTVATQKRGLKPLIDELKRKSALARATPGKAPTWEPGTTDRVRARFAEIDRVLKLATLNHGKPHLWTERLDRILVHKIVGPIILVSILALIFEAVFTWAKAPADGIEAAIAAAGAWVTKLLGEGPLNSLLVDGILAGMGSVLVFIPQILLLYAFILALEDTGYMARAAFLMDRIMGGVGLHGRAFIPLLSSFACAIPGIMATRTIENRRDRLITILVAPLMTCSARLPVYTLLISAFIPNRTVFGIFGLQGLVMLSLYIIGTLLALIVAMVLKRTVLKGATPPLLLELPSYKLPSLRSLALGLWERARLFLRRVGTVILTISILLWFLSSYPKPPEGATGPAIEYSAAGKIGKFIAPAVAPIGFNWQIGVALVPGFAAREVMVSALGTVYAVEAKDAEATENALKTRLPALWSLATALSLLAWYIVAPQCLSTFAVTRRETNSWKWAWVMMIYLTALAYLASLVTYNVARWLGG